jgi:aminoglycoside phosphotransferase (APT) family kinase protein
MTKLSPAILRWVERCAGTGTRVVSVTEMPPSATEKHMLVVAGSGTEHRLVLRRYADAVRLGVDPAYDPANEARALRLLEPTAVPAPRLVASDLAPEICDVPTLLESWVPGAPAWAPDDLDAYLSSAAKILVAIHAVAPIRPAGFPDYLPYAVADGIVPEPPSWSTRPGVWERVLDALATNTPPEPAACFIHRDYHPGNALAEHGRVVSVVDWATAAWGPPGIDLARMRMNLAEEVGPDQAERFLDAYVAAGGAPAARHPYWDLLDAADALLDHEPPRTSDEADPTRGFETWVARVLADI